MDRILLAFCLLRGLEEVLTTTRGEKRFSDTYKERQLTTLLRQIRFTTRRVELPSLNSHC